MSRGNGESTIPLADLVRTHRNRAGLTQQELARKAGISVAALRDLEQGRHSRPRPGSVSALAEALGLDSSQAAELAFSSASPVRPAARPAAPARIEHDPPPQEPVRQPRPGRPQQGLWLGVLGPLETSLDGRPLNLGPPSRCALLGLLALEPGSVVRRGTIMEVLWGQSAPSTAPSLIQAHVSRLRKLLVPDGNGTKVIASAVGGYRLQVRPEQLDLLTFRALVARADAAHAAGDDHRACDLYEQALRLWRGDPLADLEVLHNQPCVAMYRRELSDVLVRSAEIACGLGLHDRVLPRLHALAAAEPLNERVHARLMIALAGSGQQAAALHIYEDLRTRLDREFAIYPGEELTSAHLRVLRQDIPRARLAYEPPALVPAVPRQLPASARYFTGRDRERGLLSGLLGEDSPEAGRVAVAALTGMAGIGKTALAISWAHEVADRFPGGQLFADLRGFSSSGPPVDPAEVLSGFLTALGVPPSETHADTARLAALYRSTLAGRRMLIVLDNARDAEQVRPLLPGSPGCLVLVTSRHRLIGLAAGNGAHLVTVPGLTDEESHRLLARALGTERVAADPGAAGELIALCARLPLALCNATAYAAAHPDLPLGALVAEMRDEQGRLDALETGEPATSIRAAFSLSQAKLSDTAAKVFPLLGLHPGPDFSVPAVAALCGSGWSQAQAALDDLCDVHLLTGHAPGRYACHELVRVYAAEAAERSLGIADRRAAVYRLLDYYLHSASSVSALLFPHLAQQKLDEPRPGVVPESIGDAQQAVQWALDERPTLRAAIELAVKGSYYPHAWQLSRAAAWFFNSEEHWENLSGPQ
ncbi:BTAD domain-containing putative transcriptional regulator [Actinomadura montaniterrae]|uniref:Helix-turn-helix domain-containing protein n=1 Tax=Actinomadura montaniterrae TaxID=1803903 RepID=A0A6L3VZN8_9ACTN|nr:BTAD domain-containing putative transcriptional regulator [Actinomadura montaniterrae]KAB2379129.1 helix-turn-helix domain-containing protein [Actinomadura montaniterrae]